MRNRASFNASVRGQHHNKQGLELQDSSGSVYLRDVDSYAIAVADGHGDASCPRSAIGSALAVEVTLERMGEFARMATARPAHVTASRSSYDLSRLTDSIVSGWSQRVDEHYESDPIPELEQSLPPDDLLAAKAAHEHLYGTTLVAALIMPHACVLVQQGDGCITVVYDEGTVEQDEQVIAADELCVGNQTTSLSDPEAASEIRASLIDFEEQDRRVAACLVGTDGVDKSLPPDGGVSDFMLALALDSLAARDKASWEQRLSQNLSELSDHGSADDASVAGYVDELALRRIERRLQEQRQRYAKYSQLSSLRGKRRSMQRKAAYYRSAQGEQKVPPEVRQRYLSEYDELCLAIDDLERELGVESEQLEEVVLGQPTAPAPTTRMPQVQLSSNQSVAQDAASAQSDEAGMRPGAAGPSADGPVILPPRPSTQVGAGMAAGAQGIKPTVSYAGAQGGAEASQQTKPTWQRYGIPAAVGVGAILVAVGVFFALRQPANPQSEVITPTATSSVESSSTKREECKKLLDSKVKNAAEEVLRKNEDVVALRKAGVDVNPFITRCSDAVYIDDISVTSVEEEDENGAGKLTVSLRLCYEGPDVFAVLSDAAAALNGEAGNSADAPVAENGYSEGDENSDNASSDFDGFGETGDAAGGATGDETGDSTTYTTGGTTDSTTARTTDDETGGTTTRTPFGMGTRTTAEATARTTIHAAAETTDSDGGEELSDEAQAAKDIIDDAMRVFDHSHSNWNNRYAQRSLTLNIASSNGVLRLRSDAEGQLKDEVEQLLHLVSSPPNDELGSSYTEDDQRSSVLLPTVSDQSSDEQQTAEGDWPGDTYGQTSEDQSALEDQSVSEGQYTSEDQPRGTEASPSYSERRYGAESSVTDTDSAETSSTSRRGPLSNRGDDATFG